MTTAGKQLKIAINNTHHSLKLNITFVDTVKIFKDKNSMQVMFHVND